MPEYRWSVTCSVHGIVAQYHQLPLSWPGVCPVMVVLADGSARCSIPTELHEHDR